MKYPFLQIIIILILATFSFEGFAQCEGCETKNQTSADFCYTDSLFKDQCAQFVDQASSYTFFVKGKAKEIPMTKEADTKYFLSLANDKKLKLTATNILFLQEALKTWKVESIKIGYDILSSGLGIKILEKGSGNLPEQGKIVKVHYTGYLEDGTKFDSSVDRGEPFSFPLGVGNVIKGWDEGVAKLPVGTKAILQIPAELGYGSRGAGGVIPPNATLYFEIEVLDQNESN